MATGGWSSALAAPLAVRWKVRTEAQRSERSQFAGKQQEPGDTAWTDVLMASTTIGGQGGEPSGEHGG